MRCIWILLSGFCSPECDQFLRNSRLWPSTCTHNDGMTELDWYSQQLFPPTWGQGRRRRQAWSPWGNWWNSAVSPTWGSPALVGQSANNKQVMSALCVFQDNYQTQGIKHYQCWTNTPSLGHQARATSMRNRQVLPIHFSIVIVSYCLSVASLTESVAKICRLFCTVQVTENYFLVTFCGFWFFSPEGWLSTLVHIFWKLYAGSNKEEWYALYI